MTVTRMWFSWLRDEGCIADLKVLLKYLISIIQVKARGSRQRHLRKAETGSKVHGLPMDL
jgi:hypothetical protein